ncbi:hypothetical protein A2870_01930 [Candidatus Curtissbacteria bacterium RIFCSPHIGHO2_01_FULL_41_11]|uniref:Uncharacterized protein n=1 Tax=Candidatus Curtissbacteria bacterium RIFCSPHIGHO2_01_FULL_41_11 TaxID=1797711 RepID=A0A1F5G3T3_9BACT|nr:MAG: hypothetical protein A2870_01930 [Candidatus Curtissbacteria bacterium RIFCSPHIGHO2_01_FULL_41_11]
MPFESFLAFDFLNISAIFVFKAFLLLFLIFYSVFALILFRQVQLMAKAIPTFISPFLKFVAIIHVGVAVALLFVIIQLF